MTKAHAKNENNMSKYNLNSNNPGQFWVAIIDNRNTILFIGIIGTIIIFSLDMTEKNLFFLSMAFSLAANIVNSISSKIGATINYIISAFFIILFANFVVASGYSFKVAANALTFLSGAALVTGIFTNAIVFFKNRKL